MFDPPNNVLLTPTMAQSFGYWNGLRGSDTAPTLLGLDPFFAPSLLEWAIAADVSGRPENYSIWAVGDKLRPYVASLRTGTEFTDLHGSFEQSRVWQTYFAVKASATPHIAAFNYFGPAKGIGSTLELFLPFRSPDSDTIGDVVNVVEFSTEPVPVDLLGPDQRQPLTPAHTCLAS